MVTRAQVIKLKPSKTQEHLLSMTAGASRFAYNWALERHQKRYKEGEGFDPLQVARCWTQERPEWSKQISGHAMRRALINASTAYKNFFRHKAKHPKFHKKGRKDSFYCNNDRTRFTKKAVKLEKLGTIHTFEEVRFQDATLISATVVRKSDGWYIVPVFELYEAPIMTTSTTVVGIDVGCSHWATASDGTVLDEPKKIKHLQRLLRRRQRLASRRQKGSSNQKKAYKKVSRLYQRIDNVKKDAIHKFTASIAKNHGTAVIEDLDINQMTAEGNKLLRKGVQNSAMQEIHRQLMYKCNQYIKVDRWYPSSKRCSNCGSIKEDLSISDRTYQCHSCGHIMDRDLNASLNLRKEGLKVITEGHSVRDCGDTVKD